MKYQKGFYDLGSSEAVSGPYRKSHWKESLLVILCIVIYLIVLGLVGRVAG